MRRRILADTRSWSASRQRRLFRKAAAGTVDQLWTAIAKVIDAFNPPECAKYLKALRWRTPYQAICDAWTKTPSTFKIDPRHLIPGPHTESAIGDEPTTTRGASRSLGG